MELNKSGFAVGTGRCGTRFIVSLFEQEPAVAASHERNNINETFHRYCVWNDLPVDHEGFLLTKREEIVKDLEGHEFSFEASAHLALSIVPMFERFGSKFILLVRNPTDVVNSYFVGKTWYKTEYYKSDPNLAIGYHDMPVHHFLGRIIPRGDEFLRWKELTRIGKLAWMWNAINLKVVEQFEKIPKDHSMVIPLEDFDYDKYLEVGQFFGIGLSLKKRQFKALVNSRSKTQEDKKIAPSDWSAKELSDFLAETKQGCEVFGYDNSIIQDVSTSKGIWPKIKSSIMGQVNPEKR